MNRVIIMGRLVRDPDVRVSQSGTKVVRYTLAVDRRRKGDNSAEQSADFISCIAFGKGADFAELYLHKGMKIAIEGRIQTGSYTDKEGHKVYTTDIIVDSHEFCESKSGQQSAPASSADDLNGFMDVPDGISEELPFI